MIVWADEKLQGEPIYNILGLGNVEHNGVHFELANEIVSEGTSFSAGNMNGFVQKSHVSRCFYYGGEETLVTDFPIADNGLQQGVFLVKTRGGVELAAEGTVYLVVDGVTQRIQDPEGWHIARDCAIYCQMGEEVVGTITMEG